MKKKFWSVMLVVALLGVAGCLGFIAWHIFSDMGAQQVYEETIDLVTHPRDESTPADESGEEDVGESGLTVADIESVEFTGEREGVASAAESTLTCSSTSIPISTRGCLSMTRTSTTRWRSIPKMTTSI